MNWMTVGPCRMYNVSYSAEQAVNTSGWTNSQVQQQVYLGNIVPDTRTPNMVRFSGEASPWTGTYSSYMAFAFAARGSFVGPPSGQALIVSFVILKGNETSSVERMRVEVRTGSSIGNGTLVGASNSTYAYGNKYAEMITVYDAINLTPGDPYNVVQAFITSAGGGDMTAQRLVYVPMPL